MNGSGIQSYSDSRGQPSQPDDVSLYRASLLPLANVDCDVERYPGCYAELDSSIRNEARRRFQFPSKSLSKCQCNVAKRGNISWIALIFPIVVGMY